MSDNGNREIVFPDPTLDPIQIRIIQTWVSLDRVIHSQLHVLIDAQLVIRKKIDTFKILKFLKWFEEFDDSSDFSFAVVDSLQHRHPHLHMFTPHDQLFHVLQDHLVADPCQFEVSVRIDMLQVKEEQINVFRKAEDRFLLRIAACFDRRLHACSRLIAASGWEVTSPPPRVTPPPD